MKLYHLTLICLLLFSNLPSHSQGYKFVEKYSSDSALGILDIGENIHSGNVAGEESWNQLFATDKDGIEPLVVLGREWIDKENARRHPRLDLFGEERQACEREYLETERVLSNISNVFLNGADPLLDHVFDSVGFNKIEDADPVSKAATVEYLKNHFDEDLNLSKIYRYLDKLSNRQHEIVQDISVHHTRKILGGVVGVLFYDVTTLYFEADREDDLRKTGFSK